MKYLYRVCFKTRRKAAESKKGNVICGMNGFAE